MTIDELQSSLVVHKNEANYAETDEQEELLLMAHVEEKQSVRNDAWFLDSGCTNHICGNKGMFSSMEDVYKYSVKCGNNSRMNVFGKSSVRLVINDVAFHVQVVYCVPKL